jgi:P-type conjugative transfer protein TrbJ
VRYIKSIFAIALVIVSIGPACATGLPVLDIAGLTQQISHYVLMTQQYATQAKQYATQIQSLQYQYSQLQNDYRNLTNLNFKADLSGLNEMQRVMNSAVGISNDVSRIETQFETLYPDFASYQNQNGASFSQQSALWSRQNQQSALDTLRVGAAIQQNITADSSTVQTLNERSSSAQGMKDLLQVANQLLIMQTKQLMQLEQLLSSTAKADSAYLAERASKEAAAAARGKNQLQDWNKKGNRVVNPNLDRLH